MAKKILTKGTKQLTVQIDAKLRDALGARVEAERRTYRAVVELAIAHYLATVPLDGQSKKPKES